jgi:hypothetical protein
VFKAFAVFGLSSTGIVGANPTLGTDVYVSVSLLVSSCVRTDLAIRLTLSIHRSLSKESRQISKRLIVSEVNSEFEEIRGFICKAEDDYIYFFLW